MHLKRALIGQRTKQVVGGDPDPEWLWERSDGPYGEWAYPFHQEPDEDKFQGIAKQYHDALFAKGPQRISYDLPMRKDRNWLMRKLLKRRYETGMSAEMGGKPSSVVESLDDKHRRFSDMSDSLMKRVKSGELSKDQALALMKPLVIKGVPGRGWAMGPEEGSNVSITHGRRLVPTKLGYGVAAGGGALAGAGVGAAVADDKLSGALWGAGIGSVGVPALVALLSRAGLLSPKWSKRQTTRY